MQKQNIRKSYKTQIISAVLSSLILVGCQQGIPPGALQLTKENLEDRQSQTRRFDTSDEASLLSASNAVLQDLGFNLDESETKLGLIVASKDRDATEAGQVVGAVVIAILFGVSVPVDKIQKIRVSLITRPIGVEKKVNSRKDYFSPDGLGYE